MIRLIQRRLIIPRGDTGSFTIPTLATAAESDIAVFTVFDTTTRTKLFEKIVSAGSDTITINFTHEDTVNLKPGKYLWDIKFYKDPKYVKDDYDNDILVSGTEVDSYYAQFTLPVCEIRETGDNLLVSDEAPNAYLTPQQLDIVTKALNALENAVEKTEENVEHYPTIQNGQWQVWDANAGEYVSTGVDVSGPQGEKGETGNGIDSVAFDNEFRLTINFTDGTTYTSPSLRGEKGETGAPGEKGDPGYGLSAGGTEGQILYKRSSTDYDTEWREPEVKKDDLDKLNNFIFNNVISAKNVNADTTIRITDAMALPAKSIQVNYESAIEGLNESSLVYPPKGNINLFGLVDGTIDGDVTPKVTTIVNEHITISSTRTPISGTTLLSSGIIKNYIKGDNSFAPGTYIFQVFNPNTEIQDDIYRLNIKEGNVSKTIKVNTPFTITQEASITSVTVTTSILSSLYNIEFDVMIKSGETPAEEWSPCSYRGELLPLDSLIIKHSSDNINETTQYEMPLTITSDAASGGYFIWNQADGAKATETLHYTAIHNLSWSYEGNNVFKILKSDLTYGAKTTGDMRLACTDYIVSNDDSLDYRMYQDAEAIYIKNKDCTSVASLISSFRASNMGTRIHPYISYELNAPITAIVSAEPVPTLYAGVNVFTIACANQQDIELEYYSQIQNLTKISELENDMEYISQDDMDNTPIAESTNLITSGGVYEAIANINTMNIHICTASEYNAETGIPIITEPDSKTFYLVPDTVEESTDMFVEWIYANNRWEIFGSAKLDLSNYVTRTDYAGSSNAGVVKTSASNGVRTLGNGQLIISGASSAQIKEGTWDYQPLTPAREHDAVFYGLAKAAGDTTQAASSNYVGTYTDEAKTAIKSMLGITSTDNSNFGYIRAYQVSTATGTAIDAFWEQIPTDKIYDISAVKDDTIRRDVLKSLYLYEDNEDTSEPPLIFKLDRIYTTDEYDYDDTGTNSPRTVLEFCRTEHDYTNHTTTYKKYRLIGVDQTYYPPNHFQSVPDIQDYQNYDCIAEYYEDTI